jgi:hypothetical protein
MDKAGVWANSVMDSSVVVTRPSYKRVYDGFDSLLSDQVCVGVF